MATTIEPPWPVIQARVQANLDKIGRAIEKAVKDTLDDIGRDAEGLVKASITIPYPPPSSPGSPPHRRTGRLQESYRHDVSGGGSRYVLEVGSGVFYSKFLEFGTRKMAPRPHLAPAFRLATVGLRAKLVRAIHAEEVKIL